MTHHRISIIIPTLNEANQIRQRVTDLLAQGRPAVAELIVVDGGSADATVAEAEAAGARVIHFPQRSRAAQMNAGARAARGDILYFVHADCQPPASFVHDIHQALAKGYRMGCYRYRFDSNHFMLRINSWFTRLPFLWCQGGDKTFYIPKSLFFELGGYDEQFTIMEEYEFIRRHHQQHGLHIMPKDAIVSARKYAHNGWLRVQLANMAVFNLWRLGYNPAQLRHLYQRWLRL